MIAGMPSDPAPYVSVTEYAVLGLLQERPRHGFALAKEFAPDQSLGRVWSVHAPLIYRALKTLQDKGLVVAATAESSQQGPTRTLMRTTARGTTVVEEWLDTPVTHFRDVRVELLLKLAIVDRLGGDLRPLLRHQRDLLRELSAFIEAAKTRQPSGFDAILALWRAESAMATMRFLDLALDEQPHRSRRRV
jgi:PadR family transcriptional regulator AphA